MIYRNSKNNFKELAMRAYYCLDNYARAMRRYKSSNGKKATTNLITAQAIKPSLRSYLISMAVINKKFDNSFDNYPNERMLYGTEKFNIIKQVLKKITY